MSPRSWRGRQRRRRRDASAWAPRWIPLSDTLAIADTPPPLDIDRRVGRPERFIAGLNTTLRELPSGWSGPSPADGESHDLSDRVRSRFWYHTIELPGGIVTPGMFDHRALVPHYGIPERLEGKRVLDVGTWDGFWAFEFERRGATVTAVDLGALSSIDLPVAIKDELERSGLDQRLGGGFELARSALGSSAERIERSVYDLDPGELGTYDVVHFADVLMHLDSPITALRRVRSIASDTAIIVATFDPTLGDEPILRYQGGWTNAVWWSFSLKALGQMALDAGFSDVESRVAFRVVRATEPDIWEVVLHAHV